MRRGDADKCLCSLKGGQDTWKISSYFHLMLFQEKMVPFQGKMSPQALLSGLTVASCSWKPWLVWGWGWAGQVLSGEGGGSAASTVWAQWPASPGRWAHCFLSEKVWSWFWAWSTPCCDDTCPWELWGLDSNCRSPPAHTVRAVLPLFPALRYEADLKFRVINHSYAPVQQILMSQGQGWLLPTLAVISRNKSWPFFNRENGRRIS